MGRLPAKPHILDAGFSMEWRDADCIRHGQHDGSIRGDMEPEELGLFLLDA